MTDNLQQFKKQLASIETLVPREINKQKVAQPAWTKQVVTIVGVKTVLNRFLPVSHEGYGNESYVDKVDLLERRRAEFISRKMKGIERRMHMALFRELVESMNGNENWQAYFEECFGSRCIIPDALCIACWNCALFGGLDARGRIATFSRIRYFDTFSVEPAEDCVGSMDNEEMGIGNQVYEDIAQARGSDTYHLYEYVKAGTRFPFITVIESPTLLDVAGMIHAIRRADIHGYGKYSANHGKFSTEFLAVATGFPRFSVLDMLKAMEEGNQPDLKFDGVIGGDQSIELTGEQIQSLADGLPGEFKTYVQALKG